MAGPSELAIREPAFAGMFYPAEPDACRAMVREFLAVADQAGATEATPQWLGGVVPHAGWVCSGAIAGEAIAAIARANVHRRVELVVIFGAVHSPLPIDVAALDAYTRWREPSGECEVSEAIRRRVRESSGGLFAVDNRLHTCEHAVEVELPLVLEAFSGATILPVELPLIDNASRIGREVGRCVMDAKVQAVFLASSDLTHYGPAYRFAPAGVGEAGLAWAKQNDRRLLDRMERFAVDDIVAEVRQNMNACGGGAIAAMMAACRELGASRATVIRHANSYETLATVSRQSPDNAVGYASVVVG